MVAVSRYDCVRDNFHIRALLVCGSIEEITSWLKEPAATSVNMSSLQFGVFRIGVMPRSSCLFGDAGGGSDRIMVSLMEVMLLRRVPLHSCWTLIEVFVSLASEVVSPTCTCSGAQPTSLVKPRPRSLSDQLP